MTDVTIKRKVGRPKKVKLSEDVIPDQYDPVKTLKASSYDPIVETLKTIRETKSQIKWVKKQPRPSQAAIAALMATLRALGNDLLKFGYRPIPEKIINENHNFTFGIQLTDHEGSLIAVDQVVNVEDDVEVMH